MRTSGLFVFASLLLFGCGPKPNLDIDSCDNKTDDAGEVCFEAPPILASPAALLDATLLDIDDDTVIDLLAAAADGSVYIFRGNPDGGLNKLNIVNDRIETTAPAGSKVRRIFIADLQGDTFSDLVLLVEEPNNQGAIYSLLGLGGGTFLFPVRSPLSGAPIDGDLISNEISNREDIVVLLSTALELRRGDNAGSFADPRIQALTTDAPQDMALAGLNNDTLDDLLLADGFSSAKRLIANPDGSYSDAGQTAIPASNAILFGEFAGDDNADVVSANTGVGAVDVLRGLGNGDFESIDSFFVGDEPRDAKIEDLDGDGFVDITVAGGITTSFLRGFGEGDFEEGLPLWSGAGLSRVIVQDVTLDQANDVIAVGSLGVSLIEGKLGSFPAGLEIPLGKERPKVAILGDFDRDNDLDLALSINAGVAIFKNNSLGEFSFSSPQIIRLDPTPTALAVGDVDADSDLDIITLDPQNPLDPNSDGTGRIILNQAGDFNEQDVLPLSSLPAGTSSISSSDINNDQRSDLIAIGRSSATLESDGQRFINPQPLNLTNATQASLVDINQDGALDLLVGQPDQIKIFLGPSFTQEQTVAFSGTTSLVTAADINGDELNDLVVLDTETPRLSVLLSQGNVSFASPINAAVPEGAQGLAVGDSDADQVDDVLVIGSFVSQVFTLEAQGLIASSVRGAAGLAVGGVSGLLLNQDIDGDGTFDLVLPAQERGLIISRQKR